MYTELNSDMNEHLKARNTTYWPHLKFAFGAGIVLIVAGLVSIIHSILPNFMPTYAERKTLALARLARMKHAKQYNTYRKQ
jgi:hypothetical protein